MMKILRDLTPENWKQWRGKMRPSVRVWRRISIQIATVFTALTFQAGRAENLICKDSKDSWILFPEGSDHGAWTDNGGSGEEIILELRTSGSTAQPYWSINQLPVQGHQSYLLSAKVKADPGTEYRVYVENHDGSANSWQTASISATGNGEWQLLSKAFHFEREAANSYLVVQLMSPGTLQAAVAEVTESENVTEIQFQKLKAGEEITLISEADKSQWTFTADQGGSGGWKEEGDDVGWQIVNEGSGSPFWGRGELPFESGTTYRCTFRAKASINAKFRLYIENNTDGHWQNFGGTDMYAGNDEWQEIGFLFSFTDIHPPCSVIMQLSGPGEVIFSDLKIREEP